MGQEGNAEIRNKKCGQKYIAKAVPMQRSGSNTLETSSKIREMLQIQPVEGKVDLKGNGNFERKELEAWKGKGSLEMKRKPYQEI